MIITIIKVTIATIILIVIAREIDKRNERRVNEA